jgi:hypothetical protein
MPARFLPSLIANSSLDWVGLAAAFTVTAKKVTATTKKVTATTKKVTATTKKVMVMTESAGAKPAEMGSGGGETAWQ